MAKKRSHIEFSAPLMEMESAPDIASIVKADPDLVREITEGDDSPKYVIVDLIEQTSDKKINYDIDAFKLIAEQVKIKEPVGYFGHIPDKDRDSALPMPQVLWLGADTYSDSTGKAHLVVKGYVPPEGTARGLIKRRLINSVSWAGDAILTPTSKGGYKIAEYHLESIDFARKNRAGLSNQKLMLVTEEISDDNSKERKKKVDGDERTYEDIVGRLVYADLKSHNPALLKTVTEMAKDEVKDETKIAVEAREKELEAEHVKAIEALPEVSVMEQIKQILKLDKVEDAAAAVEQLLERLDELGKEAIMNWFKKDILEKKVPNERARKLVGRLIPVTEMQGDWRTEKGLDKIKESVLTKVDDALENDDEIKMIVTEMGAGRGGVRLAEMRGDIRREHGGGNNNDDDENADLKQLERRGNLKVETVSLG